MAYAQDRHRTVNGVTGFNLSKFLEFLTGEKPVEYVFNEKSKDFTFYIKDKHFEKGEHLINAYKQFFKVNVERISTLYNEED